MNDLPKILYIQVTKEHVKNARIHAKRNNVCLSTNCPIALAVTEALNDNQLNVSVTYGCISIYKIGHCMGEYKLSTRAHKFMEHFDTKKFAKSQNFKFQLI